MQQRIKCGQLLFERQFRLTGLPQTGICQRGTLIDARNCCPRVTSVQISCCRPLVALIACHASEPGLHQTRGNHLLNGRSVVTRHDVDAGLRFVQPM
jgi:hypothetical protein